MMSAINFISDHCRDSKLVVRLDDDVLLHPKNMINIVLFLLQQNQTTDLTQHASVPADAVLATDLINRTTSMTQNETGNHSDVNMEQQLRNINSNAVVCHVLRNRPIRRFRFSKYRIDNSFLPGETTYPEFCAGFFIALTINLLPKFQEMFKTERPFWIDDTYLGILQKRLGTFNIQASAYVTFNPYKRKSQWVAAHLGQKFYYSHIADNYHAFEVPPEYGVLSPAPSQSRPPSGASSTELK